MPATLKTTGPATKALAVVAAIDGVITEFVNGWTDGSGLTIDPAVAVGSSSFDGTTTEFFETFNNSSTIQGIVFDTNPAFTTRTTNKGMSGFVALGGATMNGSSQPSAVVHLQRGASTTPTTTESFGFSSSTTPLRAAVRMANFSRPENSVDVPADDGTSKLVIGWNYMNFGTDPGTGYGGGGQIYYGLDTSDPATVSLDPASPSNAQFQPAGVLKIPGIGGLYHPDDSGTPGVPHSQPMSAPGKYHIWAVFDDLLSVEEFRALHADPVGALLNVAAPTNAVINSSAGAYQDGQIDVSADISNATGVTAQLKLGGSNVDSPVALINTAGNTWSVAFGSKTGARLPFATGVQQYSVDLVASPGSVNGTVVLPDATMVSVSGQPVVNRLL